MGLTVFARIRLFVVVRFLRLVFGAMNSKRALRIMNVVTKPKGWQHSWMQLEPKTRSYIVGRNIANQSKEEVKMRMKNANVVIFYIHGMFCEGVGRVRMKQQKKSKSDFNPHSHRWWFQSGQRNNVHDSVCSMDQST
jgi:hypothetical protein